MKHCSYWVLKNETYEFFLQSPLRRRGGEGSENGGKNPLSQTRCICGWPLTYLAWCQLVALAVFDELKKNSHYLKLYSQRENFDYLEKFLIIRSGVFKRYRSIGQLFFFLQDCLTEIFKLILLAYYDIYWLFLEGVVWVVWCFSIFLYDGYNFAILQF